MLERRTVLPASVGASSSDTFAQRGLCRVWVRRLVADMKEKSIGFAPSLWVIRMLHQPSKATLAKRTGAPPTSEKSDTKQRVSRNRICQGRNS